MIEVLISWLEEHKVCGMKQSFRFLRIFQADSFLRTFYCQNYVENAITTIWFIIIFIKTNFDGAFNKEFDHYNLNYWSIY